MDYKINTIKDLVIQTLTNGSDIKAKAESGDAVACLQMGMIHMFGIDTPINFKKARNYFCAQSLNDDSDANRLLGFIAECEGNYSLAFKNYANAGKANKPYINNVLEERENLQTFFKKLELPSNLQNKEITSVLNEYIKGGETKVDACIKLAMICGDEESCIEAAQALFYTKDYHSAMRWLQKGNISDSNPLYISVKNKIADSKSLQDLPNTLEVIEIDGNSFLANFEATLSYVGIKKMCDEEGVKCKKEWNDFVSSMIATEKKKVKDEETARLKKQKAEKDARIKKQKAEEYKLFLQEQEEEMERKKKLRRNIFLYYVPIALMLIGLFFQPIKSETEDAGAANAFANSFALVFMYYFYYFGYKLIKKLYKIFF